MKPITEGKLRELWDSARRGISIETHDFTLGTYHPNGDIEGTMYQWHTIIPGVRVRSCYGEIDKHLHFLNSVVTYNRIKLTVLQKQYKDYETSYACDGKLYKWSPESLSLYQFLYVGLISPADELFMSLGSSNTELLRRLQTTRKRFTLSLILKNTIEAQGDMFKMWAELSND